jgi:hypothetical protein
MQPPKGKLIAFDEARDQLLTQREFGKALRISYEMATREPLSEAMGLLLMRLALVEMLRSARQGSRGTTSPSVGSGDDRLSVGSAEHSEKRPGFDVPGQAEEA